jgi:hypothetical protein
LLKSSSGVSAGALDGFRRDKLGPRVAGLQLDLGLARYVQTHRSDGSGQVEKTFLSLRAGASNDFCGVEEFWWKDEATALDVLRKPAGAWADILNMQDQWIDHRVSPAWLAVDYPQVATSTGRQIAALKSGILKLTFAISPLKSVGEIKARRYWLTEHGPLIRSLAPARGALAYIQVHRQREEAEAAVNAAGVLVDSPFMGHAEAWFSEAAPGAGADGQAAVQAAVADEQKFIDWSRSSVLVGKELVFVDRNWF